MVDMVVHRRDIPETLARLGRLLTKQPQAKSETPVPAPLRPMAEADALMKPHQMRRRVDVDGKPGAFEDRAHERDGRALAVGAGHMDHGRQPAFRMAELAQQPLDATERKVDRLGMQREKPRDQRIGGIHGNALVAKPALRVDLVTATKRKRSGRLRGCFHEQARKARDGRFHIMAVHHLSLIHI